MEDYENLLEMHDEHSESVDFDDIEVRELWEEIQSDLKQLTRRVRNLRRGRDVQETDIDDVEAQIEELTDLYDELGALSWGDSAVAR